MKNKIFKVAVLCFGLVFALASMSVLFAWYTNVDKIGSIEGDTEEITITYNLDDSDMKNEKEYVISNLTFFDINKPNELSYLNSMSRRIKIVINNLDTTAKDVKVSFVAKKITKTDELGNKISAAYPIGIIGTNMEIDASNKSNINDLLVGATNDEAHYEVASNDECLGNNSLTKYIHVFGSQDIPSSDNSFLINPDGTTVKYEFKIIIEAANKA